MLRIKPKPIFYLLGFGLWVVPEFAMLLIVLGITAFYRR